MSNTPEVVYKGRPITELTREELVEALTQAFTDIRSLQDQLLDGRTTDAILRGGKLFTEADMVALVESLRDYERESRNMIGFDERESAEFVEIHLNSKT